MFQQQIVGLFKAILIGSLLNQLEQLTVPINSRRKLLEAKDFQLNFWMCNGTLFPRLSKTCSGGVIMLHMTAIFYVKFIRSIVNHSLLVQKL